MRTEYLSCMSNQTSTLTRMKRWMTAPNRVQQKPAPSLPSRVIERQRVSSASQHTAQHERGTKRGHHDPGYGCHFFIHFAMPGAPRRKFENNTHTPTQHNADARQPHNTTTPERALNFLCRCLRHRETDCDCNAFQCVELATVSFVTAVDTMTPVYHVARLGPPLPV